MDVIIDFVTVMVCLVCVVFGIKILDNQLDKMLERDLAQYGYSYDPGAQFIVDYVFDLSNDKAAEAYNQILNSNFKF